MPMLVASKLWVLNVVVVPSAEKWRWTPRVMGGGAVFTLTVRGVVPWSPGLPALIEPPVVLMTILPLVDDAIMPLLPLATAPVSWVGPPLARLPATMMLPA